MATPSLTDKVSIISVQKLANGSSVRGTFNVQNKFGGRVFLRLGRLTSTAPAVGCYIRVRNILYDASNSRDIPHAATIATFQDTTTASNLTTLNGTPTFPGAAVTLTSATGFAANQTVAIVDSVSTPTRCEWQTTSKIASTTLTMDRNLANTNIVSGDTITNYAIVLPPVWVDGQPNTGDIEVIFDYGAETATSPIVVEAWGQTLDSIG